ncbi:MAG: zf-HC2 domain-containing protein [Actinobacteria bacterium]|nr:zf-HC2 domain-containing protein [Actinomycetota bacterium]
MTLECAEVRERAAELALGILDGKDRADVLTHLSSCPSCQAFVEEHNEVADLLLHLAPEADPPLGFQPRTLRAFGSQQHRGRRRMFIAVAAAAAAAIIASVTAVRIIDADRTEQAAPALRTVPMIGTDGVKVGRVTFSKSTPAALAVSVDYAVPDGDYDLALVSGNAEELIGTMTIADGQGEWNGAAAINDDDAVALVSASGARVCEAELRS